MKSKKLSALFAVITIIVLMVASVPALASPSKFLAGSWRQDVNGWIFVHVEGKPFEMGYQRGYLTAPEIADALEAYKYIGENWGYPWEFYRATARKMWWPNMPAELRQEIKGMAEGMKAQGYKVDWLDIVAANGRYDTEYYWDYLHFNNLPIPKDLGNFKRKGDVLQRLKNKRYGGGCSSFIATGDATSTHEIVFGHNTWTSYVVATGSVYNMILHMKPEKGHEILMEPQAFAIYSGRDWAINSAGLMESETTIPGMIKYYNPDGLAYFIRIRHAMQYASSIDEFISIMLKENNGAYSNDYLLGDAKTGEIAEFELGALHYAITRTFNGFIGSSNYPVSAGIRLEDTGIYDWTDPSEGGNARYQRWQQLKAQYYGQVTVELGKQFLADHYDTYTQQWVPSDRTLCGHGETAIPSHPSGCVDGKVTSSSLALRMQTWAYWGHPCDTPFYAAPYLATHPEYSWQEPYLGDLVPGQWDLFSAP